MSKKNNDSDNKLNWIALGVIILIVTAWFYAYFSLIDVKPEIRGTFGDMFGGVNALFSGLALAGIIYTILLQRNELKLQRDELRETRMEFKIQNETLKIQRFENTFFNLLNQHHQIVENIDFTDYKKKKKIPKIPTFRKTTEQVFDQTPEYLEAVRLEGRDVFKHRYDLLRRSIIDNPEKFLEFYQEHYKSAQTDFGHYFRNLYRMIKHVDYTNFFYDESKASEKEIFKMKYKYTSIIRSQLSDYELLWLFYNCLSSNGVDKFKPYIERYSIFKNLPIDLLGDPAHAEEYDKLAYNQVNNN
ncbi:putative phage abortive infection protein [Brumimicrobium aurantiacum]|uniref:Phage abortive infection protein n=1 Tax=Brumimicrobium aurantiacum TaxID=1737063 RepID=A0A3E1EWV7_9FLAO|nr:putative phage abortive infection protein [Brumimicrobium aurantiacum]RFC54041.1 hypothetical protein DXU93_10910 [Brumimicrobium aurantiacum]